jgi:transcriptional regulator with XRE-family HTH domain
MKRDDIIKLFASNLRAERARKQYSQEFLAELAQITPEYLNRLEKGKYAPSIIVAINLALALKVDIATLLPIKELN